MYGWPRRTVLKSIALAGGGIELTGRAATAGTVSRGSVIVLIDDEIHHLGDGEYIGTINSQFREPAEGDSFRTTFELADSYADPDTAELVYAVRGAQESNPVFINGDFVSNITDSPSSGLDEEQRVSVDPGVLRPGSNEFYVEAGESSGLISTDIDDFEISNIRLRLGGVNRLPRGSFTVSPTNPEMGTEVTLTATGNDPDGTVEGYRWDLDDDGITEAAGREVSHTFKRAGDVPVHLYITDGEGATGEVTQMVPVEFRFVDYSEKMGAASKLHERSILSDIESLVDVDVGSDPEMARSTLDSLERAVNRSRIQQEEAEDAFTRHLLAERATSDILARLGPSEAVKTNLARTTAKFTIQTVVDALLVIAAIKASVGASVGLALKVALATASKYVTDAVSHLIGEMTPKGDNVNIENDIQQSCQKEADSILERVFDGTISAVDDIADAVETAVDGLVDTFAGAFRAYVELESYDAFLNSAIPSMTSFGGTSLYSSLWDLDQRLQPEAIAEDGLRGSTETVAAVFDETTPRIIEGMEGTVAQMEQFGSINEEFNIYETIRDLRSDASDLSVEYLQQLLSLVKDGVAGIILDLSSTFTGALSFIIVKETHNQLIRAAIEGQQVPFTHV